MGLGVGLFLIAVGAIITFAVNAHVGGLNLDVIGWILMGVGLAGILLSLIFWSSWGGPRSVSRRRTTYEDEAPGY